MTSGRTYDIPGLSTRPVSGPSSNIRQKKKTKTASYPPLSPTILGSAGGDPTSQPPQPPLQGDEDVIMASSPFERLDQEGEAAPVVHAADIQASTTTSLSLLETQSTTTLGHSRTKRHHKHVFHLGRVLDDQESVQRSTPKRKGECLDENENDPTLTLSPGVASPVLRKRRKFEQDQVSFYPHIERNLTSFPVISCCSAHSIGTRSRRSDSVLFQRRVVDNNNARSRRTAQPPAKKETTLQESAAH